MAAQKVSNKIGCTLSYDSEPEWQLRTIDFTSLLVKYISSRQIVGFAEASGTERGLVSSLKTDAKCWLKALAIFNDPFKTERLELAYFAINLNNIEQHSMTVIFWYHS